MRPSLLPGDAAAAQEQPPRSWGEADGLRARRTAPPLAGAFRPPAVEGPAQSGGEERFDAARRRKDRSIARTTHNVATRSATDRRGSVRKTWAA